MTTIYIRDVADEVAEVLKDRAAAAGLSLSSYAAAELTRIAMRPTNAQVVERLRNIDRSGGASTEQIVASVREGRDARH